MEKTNPPERHNPEVPGPNLQLSNPLQVEWINQRTQSAWDNIKFVLQLFVPVVAAIFGYKYVSELDTERERINRLQNTRIEGFIEAYEQMSKAYILQRQNGSGNEELQMAFTKIHLFGDTGQIRATNTYFNRISKDSPVNLTPIFNSIKNSLRTDLGLPTDTSEVYFVLDPRLASKPDSLKNLRNGIYVTCPNTKSPILLDVGEAQLNQSQFPIIVNCRVCGQEHEHRKNSLWKMKNGDSSSLNLQ